MDQSSLPPIGLISLSRVQKDDGSTLPSRKKNLPLHSKLAQDVYNTPFDPSKTSPVVLEQSIHHAAPPNEKLRYRLANDENHRFQYIEAIALAITKVKDKRDLLEVAQRMK